MCWQEFSGYSIETLHVRNAILSLQSSYYLRRSSVVYSPGQVLTMEETTYQNLPCAYGSDTGDCHTLRVLQYLRGCFGPVASFSGSYRADSWTLQISRQNRSSVFATNGYEIANCSFIGITILICRLYSTNNHKQDCYHSDHFITNNL